MKSAAIFLILAGCSAGVEDLEGLNGGRPGERDAGPGANDAGEMIARDAGATVETSVFDPRADHVASAPTIVFEPGVDEALGQYQGSDFELVWTGRRYVLAWIHNVRGHLFVYSTTVDPDTLRATAPQVLTLDYREIEDAPESVAAIYQRGRVVIAVSTTREVMIIELDDRGLRTATPILRWDHAAPFPIMPLRLLGRPDGYALFGAFRLYVLDHNGMHQNMAPFLLGMSGYPGFDADGRLQVLFGERIPAGDDVVFRGRFNERYELLGDPELVYRSEDTSAAYFGPPDALTHAAVWDRVQGDQWIDLDGGDAPIRLGEPGYQAPLIAHHPSEPRFVVVHRAGLYLPDNPLPDRIEVEAIDYRLRERTARTVLYDGDPNRECVEHVRAAVAGERLGIAWVMGCSERVLRFAELRGERGQ